MGDFSDSGPNVEVWSQVISGRQEYVSRTVCHRLLKVVFVAIFVAVFVALSTSKRGPAVSPTVLRAQPS